MLLLHEKLRIETVCIPCTCHVSQITYFRYHYSQEGPCGDCYWNLIKTVNKLYVYHTAIFYNHVRHYINNSVIFRAKVRMDKCALIFQTNCNVHSIYQISVKSAIQYCRWEKTDTTSPVCIRFMHFMHRTRKKNGVGNKFSHMFQMSLTHYCGLIHCLYKLCCYCNLI